MKLNWKIVLAILLVLAFLVGFPVGGHYRAKWALEGYRKQLIQRGERLAIAEIAPHYTTAELNAGRDFLAAAREVGSPSSSSNYSFPPMMRILAPGRAMVGWYEETLPTDQSSNVWSALNQEIRLQTPALAVLRARLEVPARGFDLDFNKGFDLLLAHLPPAKVAAIWFSEDAFTRLHEHELPDAVGDIKAGVALSRQLGREPVLISQLMRIAIEQIAVPPTWEALQSPNWRDEDLAAIQAAWDSDELKEAMEPSLEMERATAPITYQMGRRSFTNAVRFGSVDSGISTTGSLGHELEKTTQGFEALQNRYQRYWMWKWQWSYEEELYNSKIYQAILEAIRAIKTNGAFIPEIKKFEENQAKIRKLYADAESRFLFGVETYPMQTYLLKVGDVEMERRLLVTAIALKRYHLREGKYPAQLQDLVPTYLANVPLDPMDGKPLRYQFKPDGTYLLYSVGEDGVDNGGDPTPTQSADVTNKSWWKARDAVWPWPATPDEVKAYKQEALAKFQQNEARKKPATQLPVTPGSTN